MTITRTQAFSLLEGLTTEDYLCQCDCSDCYNSVTDTHQKGPLPVTLLDVLHEANQDDRGPCDSDGRCRCNECMTDGIVYLWQSFGFKTPLRDILEGATWEEKFEHIEDASSGITEETVIYEVLKDEKVEALILFLQSLGL